MVIDEIGNASLRVTFDRDENISPDTCIRLLDHDEVAFQEVYQKTHVRLTGIVGKRLRNQHEVEDVVAETYARLWKIICENKATLAHGPSSLILLINGIAKNCVLHVIRHNKVRERKETPYEQNVIDQLPSGQRWDVSHENEDAIEKAMAGLDTKFKMVIILFHFEDLSLEEIAAKLSLSVGTIKSRLFRARRKINLFLTNEKVR